MAKSALEALARHFEEQYGKLALPEAKKKRKWGSAELEKDQTELDNQEEEWHGIQDLASQSSSAPYVMTFTETSTNLEETERASYKSFMVYHLIVF